MPQLFSADVAPKIPAPSRKPVAIAVGRPSFPYDATVRVSLWASVAVVAVLFGWGAWQRRWIADDGLIVLRTVRNLLAGNGPVFNAGERVGILLVEQNAAIALDLADRVYLFEVGRVVLSGPPSKLRSDESLRRAYLGY